MGDSFSADSFHSEKPRPAARSEADLDEAFLSWLGARPELLLSLASTTYPVQPAVWENMQRLWQESELRAEAERNTDFADQMVGFAYMQRRTSVDGYYVDMDILSASGGRGDPTQGHGGTLPDGKKYGKGKNPVALWGVRSISCSGRESGFPERDEHPNAVEVLKYQIQQGAKATHHPWPLIPLGYC